MKKFEIVIKGKEEEQIALEILQGIYAAIQNHGYTDVSVQADTIEEYSHRDIQVPDFLRPHQRGVLEREMAAARR